MLRYGSGREDRRSKPTWGKTGWVAWKSEAHRRGLWHRCFHCWIVAPEEPSSGPYLFVQRRAADKETWPDKLDVTATGHLAAGERVLDGLRELEEELGLRVEPEELIPLGTSRIEQEISAGCDREFHEVFWLVRSLTPEDLRLQKEEVAAVLRLRLDDVEWSGRGVSTGSVRLVDFVLPDEDYLLRVARAARAYLADERPAPFSNRPPPKTGPPAV